MRVWVILESCVCVCMCVYVYLCIYMCESVGEIVYRGVCIYDVLSTLLTMTLLFTVCLSDSSAQRQEE